MTPLSRTRARPCLALALAVLALGARAPTSSEDPQEELKAIEAELKQEYQELRRTASAAADDEAIGELYRDFHENVLPEFAARYAAVARAHGATDVARDAWLKVVGLVSQGMKGEIALEGLKALTSDHLASKELAGLARNLRHCTPALPEDEVLAALRVLAEKSPHRDVQAAALYGLGAVLGEGRVDGDPRIAEAKAVLAKLAAYADVNYSNGRSYADAAESFVFALDHLVVGKPCPDFEAVDAEGVAFKLSDYAGKVVLIDFWGFW